MHWRKTTGLALLMVAVAGIALAAERATLADAAERRDRAAVRTMLTGGVDVNATQVDGTTALHWAAYYEDAETAALLVKAGANVNAANRYGVPPLALACTNGNAAVVKLLLEAGADANATMKGGETVLMLAARAGSVDAVKALLVRGAKHDVRERHGQTALMWAAAEGHAPIVRALIEAGADINATLDSGFTPFFFAVREGRIEAAHALLEKGIDVNAPIQRRERTAEGANPNYILYRPIPRGTSPLLLAVQNAHYELAIALIDAGANPNDVQNGFSPLHMISAVRKPDSSDGSDPSTPPVGQSDEPSVRARDREAGRERQSASRQRRAQVPRYVLAGRDPGATPFLLTADRSDVPLMRLLLELGADPMLRI